MELLEPFYRRAHDEHVHRPNGVEIGTRPPSRYYVRILAKSRGVVTPPVHLPSALSFLAPFTRSPSLYSESEEERIPLHIYYERVYMGLIPRSLLSTLASLVCVVAAASFALSPITKFLDNIARLVVAAHEGDTADCTQKSL